MKIMEIRRKQILELCQSCIKDYKDLLEPNDFAIINNAFETASQIELDKEQIKMAEQQLLPIVEKIWEKDLDSGDYVVISWNKYSKPREDQLITFATLCEKDNIISFCSLEEGTEYHITFDALFGALHKDGATLIEDRVRQNDYTIGFIGDKVINSYNGATKLITPKQLVQKGENDYPSKHNELILNSKYIESLGEYQCSSKKRER